MHKIYALLLFFLFFYSCKHDKASLSGTEKVSAGDFLHAFADIKLPAYIGDTALKNFGDTTVISTTVFTQFIADTALKRFTGNAGKAIIHPAGIIRKKERDFLLATFTAGRQTSLGVFVLDDKHRFLSSFPLLTPGEKDDYKYSVSITEEPTFILKKEKRINNISLYTRNGYAYSPSAKTFSNVLNDSNEDTARNSEIINPIDTFPAVNKYSGDYIKDKKNFISVRDGKNANAYFFFVHFEKSTGNCVGELKGVLNLTGEKNGIFTESGDPCVIRFRFAGSTVTLKEEDNCGNHRGITCPFDFTFKKKKTEKAKHG
ncbi:hypothetical protein [Parafilimonas sp.]|uniref:hypothetical protein n=1 Tax=Parafilimonas sp. TaxID=1969739 RepID=UPI0039E72A03